MTEDIKTQVEGTIEKLLLDRILVIGSAAELGLNRDDIRDAFALLGTPAELIDQATTQILSLIEQVEKDAEARTAREILGILPHEGKDLEVVVNACRSLLGFADENTPELKEEK